MTWVIVGNVWLWINMIATPLVLEADFFTSFILPSLAGEA